MVVHGRGNAMFGDFQTIVPLFSLNGAGNICHAVLPVLLFNAAMRLFKNLWLSRNPLQVPSPIVNILNL
jgi:hypothetical protein